MTEIDDLSIKISADSKSASDSLDLLVKKLDKLYSSLGKIGGDGANRAVKSIDNLTNVMKKASGVDTSKFDSIYSAIRKLSKLDSESIRNAANSVLLFSNQVSGLTSVEKPAESLAVFASSISKLGGKNAQQAITTIPQLSGALNLLMTELSKAPKVNKNLIAMTNALANLASNGKKASTASRALVTSLTKTNQALSKTSKNANNAAASFGRMYLSFYTVIRGLRALYGSFEDAMDLAETVNYFEVTLDNIGKDAVKTWDGMGYASAEAYAESFAKSLRENTEKMTGLSVSETGQIGMSKYEGLGLSPAMVTQYSAMFAQVANSIGMTEKASVALSETFVRLGADWASLRNLDFEEVYEKLGSAMSGQSRALRTLGVDISLARLQEVAYQHGITKTVAEMTQAEKTYLRLIAIVEQSEVAYGDLANTISLPANSIRLLKQGLQNFSTLTGTLFMPILQKVLPVMNGFVIALNKILVSVAEMMGINTEQINQSIGGIDENFGNLGEDIGEAAEEANKFNKAIRGWDELNIVSNQDATILDSIVGNNEMEKAFNETIDNYRKEWNKAYEDMENKAGQFADSIIGSLKEVGLVDAFADITKAIKDWNETIKPYKEGYGDGFTHFFKTLGEVKSAGIKTLAEGIGLLSSAVGIFPNDILEAFGNVVGTLAGSLVALAGVNGLSKIFTALKDGVNGLGGALSTHSILAKFTLATGILSLFDLPGKYDKENAENMFSGLIEDVDKVAERLGNLEKKSKDAKDAILAMDDEDAIEIIFKQWSDLALKAEELTAEEKGLLAVYGQKLGDILPGAKDLIDANRDSYAGVVAEVQKLMEAEVSRLRMLSYQDYLSLSIDQELEFELELRNAEKALQGVEESLQKMFPDLGMEQIQKMAEYFSKYEKEDYPFAGFLDFIGLGPESPYDLEGYFGKQIWEVDDFSEFLEVITGRSGDAEAEQAKTLFESLLNAQEGVEKAEELLEIQRQETLWATERATEAEKKYQEELGNTGEAISKVGELIKRANEKREEFLEKMEKEGPSVLIRELDKLWDALKNEDGKEYSSEFHLKTFLDDPLGLFNFYPKTKDYRNPAFSNMSFSLPYASPESALFTTSTNTSKALANSSASSINEDRITDKISNSVYTAITKALQNGSLALEIESDPNGMFRVMQKQANQFTKVTGKNAFG